MKMHGADILARRLGLLFIAALLLLPVLAHAEELILGDTMLAVRSGPGNEYPMSAILSKGSRITVHSSADDWSGIVYGLDKIGYARTSKLQSQTFQSSPPSLKIDYRFMSIVVAGVRGVTDIEQYALNYAGRKGITPDVLRIKDNTQLFTQYEYKQFKKALESRKYIKLGVDERPMGLAEGTIGAMLALHFTQQEPIVAGEVGKYVALLGTYLQSMSPMFDDNMRFIVLDSQEPGSFSTPGGYVFITTGALGLMESEDELACVMAHEIAHVLLGHGLEEIKRQGPKISQREAMDEMDREIEAEFGQQVDRFEMAAEELEVVAQDMYRVIQNGRKLEDEEEADKIGALLAARSGYNPFALSRFLSKIAAIKGSSAGRASAYIETPLRIETLRNVIEKKMPDSDTKKRFEIFKNNLNLITVSDKASR